MNKLIALLGSVIVGELLSSSALADVALGVRAGTFGYGADVDVGLNKTLNVRVGYNTLNYDRTVKDTDVSYDGTLKIGAASAIFDWHVFNGGFRLSAGVVQKGPKIDVIGTPNATNSYVIGGTTYTAAEIGRLSGTVKMGDSVAPYLGIGWGNTVDTEDHVTFLLDIGVIRTGSPKVSLNASSCPEGITSAQCNQLHASIDAEIADLEAKAKDYQWYPVVDLGVAIRF